MRDDITALLVEQGRSVGAVQMATGASSFDETPAMVCAGFETLARGTVAHRTGRPQAAGLERAGIEPAAREGLESCASTPSNRPSVLMFTTEDNRGKAYA